MMMRSLERLRNGLAVAQLVPAYLLIGVLKHLIPLRWLARWAWCSAARARDPEIERRLAAYVRRLSYLAGLADRDCLQRSLLLYRLLSRAGADPKLVIGLEPREGFRGHAWVVVDGYCVTESPAELIRFAPILAFGMQGALLPKPPHVNSA
jgi:Transglutaminase-like superfamily